MKKLFSLALVILSFTVLPAQKNNHVVRRYFADWIGDSSNVTRPLTVTGDTGVFIAGYAVYPKSGMSIDFLRRVSGPTYVLYSPNGQFGIWISFLARSPFSGTFINTKTDVAIWRAQASYNEPREFVWQRTEEESRLRDKWFSNLYQLPGEKTKPMPIAVIDNGEIITTMPGDPDFHFDKKSKRASDLQLGVLKGLYAWNPATKITRTIDAKAAFRATIPDGNFQLTKDGMHLVIEEPGEKQTTLTTYDLMSGEHWQITLPAGSRLRQTGTDVALICMQGSAPLLQVVQLRDGKELLKVPVTRGSAFAAEPDFKNMTMHGNELHFINLVNRSIGCMQPDSGRMVLTSVVELDTAGTLVREADYYLGVTKDFYAMVPYTIPAGYSRIKPNPLYAYFFRRSDGEADLAIWPFFQQHLTAEEQAERDKISCKYLTESSPFPNGAHVTRADGTGPVVAWIIDCKCNCYRVHSNSYEKLFVVGSEWIGTSKPVMSACPRCRGKGTLIQTNYVADDAWRPASIGFDIYVKNPKGVKAVQGAGVCTLCNGTGQVKD